KAVKDAERFADEDKKKREAVDTRNGADQMVFQTEKAMEDMGDKISADEKADITAKLDALKEVLKGDDMEAIKAKQDEVQKAFYAVSEKMYKDAAAAQQAAGGAQDAGPDAGAQNDAPHDDNVVDADFKEV
ncbi:MAG: Hsp70 family protein, partial [Ruthenibacterium sp.]